MNVGSRLRPRAPWVVVTVVGVWIAYAASGAVTTRPTTTTAPVDQNGSLGPDIVVLRELEQLYDPVPFDHKSHAKMAQMWDGCVTCHHRPPQAATRPATQSTTQAASQPVAPATVVVVATTTAAQKQAGSAWMPACKSCHAPAADETDIRMPSLKGAYHRQCLNCHKEWMHGNACVICHKAKGEQSAKAVQPTRDDVVGRMHPPIPEPDTHLYKMRYTPADGGNVLFRHKEHSTGFGLRCVNCHRNDNCSHCHDSTGDKSAQKPVRPGMTWSQSHGPCMSCHQQDRCQECHYKDDQQPPPAFIHAMTGQELDAEHMKLSCVQCHAGLKTTNPPTCGDSSCHKKDPTIAFPAKRPGPVATTRPAATVRSTMVKRLPTTRPVRTGSPGF